jgi:hypothetical protein
MTALPTPPFTAILITSPIYVTDPSETIVSLETGTSIQRTTLTTLTQHESDLKKYLNSKCIIANSPKMMDDLDIPKHVHIFLDRASAP